MKLNVIFTVFLLCTSPCFATSFSFGESIEVQNKRELVDLVLQNKEYCTVAISNGKIYLNSENIFPSKQGAFLRIDRFFLVKLPAIYSDEDGCFINLTDK